MDTEWRGEFDRVLSRLYSTLNQSAGRYFLLSGGDSSIFVWLQHHEKPIDWKAVNDKASAAALSAKASSIICLVAEVTPAGIYRATRRIPVDVPTERTADNVHLYDDAERMASSSRSVDSEKPERVMPAKKGKRKIGRNKLCPCGSGTKFKRCHGR